MFSVKNTNNILLDTLQSVGTQYNTNLYLLNHPVYYKLKDNQSINIQENLEKQVVLYSGNFNLILENNSNNDLIIYIGSDTMLYAQNIAYLYGLDNSFPSVTNIASKNITFTISVNSNNYNGNIVLSVLDFDKGNLCLANNINDTVCRQSINLFNNPVKGNSVSITAKAVFNPSGVLEKIIFYKN